MSIKQALLWAGYHQHESELLVKTLENAGYVIVPVEPTEAMLNGARDWSCKKNGQGVGNDQATGCYQAMLAARPLTGL